MKAAPAIIIAVAAVAFVGRRLWSRRQPGARSGRIGWPQPRLSRLLRLSRLSSRLSPRSETGLVAAREIRERVRGRTFRVVTVLILLVVAAAIVIPAAVKGKSHPQRIGVVGSLGSATRAALATSAAAAGTRVELVDEPSQSQAEAGLRSGSINLAVVGGRQVLLKRAPAATDASTTASLARALSAQLGYQQALAAAQLSPDQQSLITGARPVPIVGLEPAPSARSEQARGTTVIGIILVFVMLSQYETWTLIGVMEEKSSRVVEVLLATVRPIQLLGGKVLGIGLVALGQASAILAFAVILGEVVGSPLLHGAAPLMLVAALVWLVTGYAFYCWVYAAAGSLAERQDQVQSLVLPLSIPMLVGYILALTAATSGHASLFFEVLAYLPPTAPFAMPILVGLGAVSWWGFAASVVISLVCTIAVARLAAAVYRRAVLRTGRRVHLREVLASR